MRVRKRVGQLGRGAGSHDGPGNPGYGKRSTAFPASLLFRRGSGFGLALHQIGSTTSKNRPLPPEPYTQVIVLSPEERRQGERNSCSRTFPGEPYGVVAFREARTPEKDRSQYFKDPVSAYKMTVFSGSWSDIKFEVNRDVTGLQIRF